MDWLVIKDANKDGVFTVQELIHWVETNQLVKFVEEGRDADMDRIIEKQSSSAEQPPEQTKEEHHHHQGSSAEKAK